MSPHKKENNSAQTIGIVANGMLDGSINYLVGAYRIAFLRHEVGAYANDPDFMPFVAILSEIDQLGFSCQPTDWDDAFIEHNLGVISDSSEWAKSISLHQCRSLSERFRT